MHKRDDIFYAVRACITMHNMMVEECINANQEEDSLFYEAIEEQPMESYVDCAEKETDEEDALLVDNAELGDLNNKCVDLELRRRMQQSQLQIAVKTELYQMQFGQDANGDELGNFDLIVC
eukprot:13896555-Ditylum_brightwellii.AAC.1